MVPWVQGQAQQSKFEVGDFPKASPLHFHAQTHGPPGSQDPGCPGLSWVEEGSGCRKLIGCRGGGTWGTHVRRVGDSRGRSTPGDLSQGALTRPSGGRPRCGVPGPDRRGRPSAEAIVQLLRTLFSSLSIRETAVGTIRPAPQTVLKMMS